MQKDTPLFAVPKDYTWPLKISTYDAGRDRRLTLSGQLRLQQEVGELHLGGAGLTWEEFLQHGMVFVLTKLNTVIYRAPLLDESIFLPTWHRDTKGAQFFRCYQFLDAQENVLIDSVSAFALVDPVEHKLLRPHVFEQFGVGTQPERLNGCPDPGKIKPPAELEPVGKRPIYWSDLDYNGHLNNTKYADIVCDFLPGGMAGCRIKGLHISYLKEAVEGDVLDIEAASSDGEVWVAGSHERGRCFEARLLLEGES